MNVRAYLPSTTFSTIAGSIGLAGLLILSAQYITHPKDISPAALAPTNDAATATDADWQAALAKIAVDSPSLPEAPTEEKVNQLLNAAQSSNITDTVARSLLINLSSASAQGLGSDIPTQEKLIASAVSQLPAPSAKKTYAQKDLTVGADTPAAQKAYGNAVMEALGRHTDATSKAVLLAVSQATDSNDPSALEPLGHLQAEYAALAADLADITVPKTLVPLHLQVANAISTIAAAVGDMQKLFSDPLRGLQAIQQYQFMLGEVGRVFTSEAEILTKNGILFNKDEPGAAWAVFVSVSSQ